MLRRLPAILGAIAALATLLLLGPVAAAVALLRSSSAWAAAENEGARGIALADSSSQ